MNKDLVVTLEYKKPNLIVKIIIWLLAIFLFSLVALFIYLNVMSNRLIKQFSSGAEISKEEFLNIATSSLKQFQTNYQQVDQLSKKVNFLILGTDKLSGRDGDPELTDSMLLLQLDFENGKVKTMSLPRDLYSEQYQTRINALYFYGQEKYKEHPEQFPEEVIEELSSLAIDHTIVIGIEDLEKLINLVGEIEIDVPIAFTDPLFPVPGIDVSQVTDPKVLYEEVSFQKGPQKMDAATALKYMRSRHSGDDEGTDQARAARQQLVLQALMKQILQKADPQILGQLYRFYLDQFAKYISLEELTKISVVAFAYLEKNQNTNFEFSKHQLSVYPDQANGVIYNPPLWQTKQQWIYKIKDQNKFKEEINAFFN